VANVGAKNISPVQKVMCGRNRQAVMRHQWPTSGRKIFRRAKNDAGQKWLGDYAPPMADVWEEKRFRPYKWMIG